MQEALWLNNPQNTPWVEWKWLHWHHGLYNWTVFHGIEGLQSMSRLNNTRRHWNSSNKCKKKARFLTHSLLFLSWMHVLICKHQKMAGMLMNISFKVVVSPMCLLGIVSWTCMPNVEHWGCMASLQQHAHKGRCVLECYHVSTCEMWARVESIGTILTNGRGRCKAQTLSLLWGC